MDIKPELRRPLIIIGAVAVALLAIGLIFSGRPGDTIYGGPPIVAEGEATDAGEEIAGAEVDASGQTADPGIVDEPTVEAAAAVEEATGRESPGEPAIAQPAGGDAGEADEAAAGPTSDAVAGEGDAFQANVAEGPPPQAEVPEQAGEDPTAAGNQAPEAQASAGEAEPQAESAAAQPQAGAEEPEAGEQAAAEAPAPDEPAAAPEAGAEAASAPAEAETELALAGDPAAGERVFRQCQACHQVGDDAQNRVGPILTGVVGRPAASVDGFRYSGAMQAAADEGLVWTPETLAPYLANPRSYVEGTAMAFAGLRSEEDIANVIAYLASHE